ncbi:zona pellucida sperm-binding protein 3 [Phascolarctos cinereus]|uniref:Zona pellucida sperm-binding protein 3 n=1 Tax=Phascolarctos cinereus TaxID=38626 RepID=A0A6P5LWA0_PHACI|nr:zona pellucida sperm-binding protein 3 [Phascolarctos cinereus]
MAERGCLWPTLRSAMTRGCSSLLPFPLLLLLMLPGASWQAPRFHQPVQVQCLESIMVVTVQRDLFGTGKLVKAMDLSLGAEGCKPATLPEDAQVITFEVGLHKCGNVVQVTPDGLIYSTSLFYRPRPVGNFTILRTNQAEVPIECHYPRWSNVSSRAIQPTWVPFRSTITSENKFNFSLHLMNDDWTAESTSAEFHLGDTAHLQAEVHKGNHMDLKLFVDSCVATLSPDKNSEPRYGIMDYHGCLVDGLSDSSSAFRAPRPKPDTLQFTVDVFHFVNDSRKLIYITCHLRVTAEDQAPDQINKACSFNKSTNSWFPVEGPPDICRCCNTKDCGNPNQSRRLLPISAKLFQQQQMREADITVGPVFLARNVSRHTPWEPNPDFVEKYAALSLGLSLIAVLVFTLVIMALILLCRKHNGAS